MSTTCSSQDLPTTHQHTHTLMHPPQPEQIHAQDGLEGVVRASVRTGNGSERANVQTKPNRAGITGTTHEPFFGITDFHSSFTQLDFSFSSRWCGSAIKRVAFK